MIDFDEFDWRKGISAIIFALIVIGFGIYLLNDYTTSNRIKADIQNQLDRLDQFYATWKPPSQSGLAKMRSQIAQLKSELAGLERSLPLEVNTDEILQKLTEEASYAQVELETTEWDEPRTEDFLKIYPLKLAITGTSEQISKFLIALEGLPYPNRRTGKPVITVNRLETTIEFLAFDKQGWMETYACKLPAEFPVIKEVNIKRVKFFKDDLAQLKSKLDAQLKGLQKVRKLLDEKCQLEKEISALKKQIELSKKFSQ